MTTKELENKLKIIKDTAINCSTLELAKQVLSILHQLGLKWCTGIAYTKCTDWDKYKENTIYYPFEGRFASLKHFQQLNGKIISAEEFITLHTEKEEFDLENYVPKGQLEGFPKEIIAKILDYQVEQGNKRDISVFEKYKDSAKTEGGFDWDKNEEKEAFWREVIMKENFNIFFEKYPKKEDNQDNSQEFNLENYVPKGKLEGFPKEVIKRILDCQEEQGNERDISVFEENKFSLLMEGGFDWDDTKERYDFWNKVISYKNFDFFFQKYPKKEDTSQEFKIGDKVIDIILGKIGIVKEIILNDGSAFPIEVYYEDCGIVLYTLEGKYSSIDKYPRLLHYRNDYDYSVIDFKNLPKREEHQRWRAEKGEIYYFIKRDDYDNRLDRVCRNKDNYFCISNEQYKIGNYFQTEEQAQEVADKLKEYFNQLINK